ncbi:glycosyltransferase family 4 protein [Winogradskyella rapida]|uniref:Glycosyltransferase family 4 protein n=1 Tax=Winogradskyella rapida TaxID=549701 RepID=A0ABW3KL99_9FLAO
MENKRLLIVTSEFPPQPGGIGNHAYHLALYLSKHGYAVSVIADQRDVANAEEVAFDADLDFEVQRITISKPRFLMYGKRIITTLGAFKQADYVIATGKFSLWNVGFCSLFFKRFKLAVIHGSEVNFKSAVLRKSIDRALKRFDKIVAVSTYTAGFVKHLNKPVVVIPNGITLESWPMPAPKSRSLSGNPVLTTVGRVSTRKGQLGVIKLLPELVKAYPELMYHCIGIPTEAAAFLETATALGVREHVCFHGAVSDAELKQLLGGTDVFVMLSTESQTGDVEGFGIAILEANAMGIPAIGSVGCGIADAVSIGASGYLVPSTDAAAFKSYLDALLSDQESYRAQARAWAAAHDWDVVIKHYIRYLS